MPILMDRHDMRGLTAADVAEAHRKDLGIQDQYGVKYLTYWYDAERDTGFCLVERLMPRPRRVCTAMHMAKFRPRSFPSISLRSRRSLAAWATPATRQPALRLERTQDYAASW